MFLRRQIASSEEAFPSDRHSTRACPIVRLMYSFLCPDDSAFLAAQHRERSVLVNETVKPNLALTPQQTTRKMKLKELGHENWLDFASRKSLIAKFRDLSKPTRFSRSNACQEWTTAHKARSKAAKAATAARVKRTRQAKLTKNSIDMAARSVLLRLAASRANSTEEERAAALLHMQ